MLVSLKAMLQENDSQQHIVTTLFEIVTTLFQHCNAVLR